MGFQVGDRVVMVDGTHTLREKCGTVVCNRGFVYGVRFDTELPLLHNLDGKCDNHHGWWCQKGWLEPVIEHSRNLSDLEEFLDG